MNQAIQIIQNDMREYVSMGLPIQAYDGWEAANALESAGIDPEGLEYSPAELICAAIAIRCLENLQS